MHLKTEEGLLLQHMELQEVALLTMQFHTRKECKLRLKLIEM